MTSLSTLLAETAKKPAKKKSTGGVTIKISGGGSEEVGASANKPAKAKKKSASGGLKLGDLLKHHEQSAAHHRHKVGEHDDFVKYHNAMRDGLRHMGPQHAAIRDLHVKLADAYSKLGRDTYRASKTESRATVKKQNRPQ